jgi:hypothetical protein
MDLVEETTDYSTMRMMNDGTYLVWREREREIDAVYHCVDYVRSQAYVLPPDFGKAHVSIKLIRIYAIG